MAGFLRTATTLAEQDIPYTITIVKKENSLKTLRFRDPRTALLTATKYALEAVEVDYSFIHELVGPSRRGRDNSTEGYWTGSACRG